MRARTKSRGIAPTIQSRSQPSKIEDDREKDTAAPVSGKTRHSTAAVADGEAIRDHSGGSRRFHQAYRLQDRDDALGNTCRRSGDRRRGNFAFQAAR